MTDVQLREEARKELRKELLWSAPGELSIMNSGAGEVRVEVAREVYEALVKERIKNKKLQQEFNEFMAKGE